MNDYDRFTTTNHPEAKNKAQIGTGLYSYTGVSFTHHSVREGSSAVQLTGHEELRGLLRSH